MSKFQNNLTLSYKDIRGKRASLITEDVKIAQEDVIKNLSDQKRSLERKLLDLEDLSPDSEMSLHPGRKEFNPVNWVNQVQDTKVTLEIVERKLTIAKDTYEEFFGEVKTTTRKTTTK